VREALSMVQVVRSGSDEGDQTAHGVRARSDTRGLGRAIRIGRRRSDRGKKTAAGGAAPLHGGEVTGVEASAS
jgi:hypothetical protein